MKRYCPKFKRRRQQIRHTHSVAAGLEDALSVLLDIFRILDRLAGLPCMFHGPKVSGVLIDELDAMRERACRIEEILKILRCGPHTYDPDSPAGLRIVIKRR